MNEARTIHLLMLAYILSLRRPILFVRNSFGVHGRVVCSHLDFRFHQRRLHGEGGGRLAYRTSGDIIYKVRGTCFVKMRLTTWHRFLIVVLSAYKQMKSQGDNILSDVGEDNFDRAFKFLRPGVIFRRQ